MQRSILCELALAKTLDAYHVYKGGLWRMQGSILCELASTKTLDAYHVYKGGSMAHSGAYALHLDLRKPALATTFDTFHAYARASHLN